MVDLVNEGFFQAGCTSTDYETAQNLFTSGQAAMFINGDWDISSLVEKMGDDVGYFESYPMADAGKSRIIIMHFPVALHMRDMLFLLIQRIRSLLLISFQFWQRVL